MQRHHLRALARFTLVSVLALWPTTALAQSVPADEATAAADQPTDLRGELHLSNDDVIPGRLVAADASTVQWHSESLGSTLQLRHEFVERMLFRSNEGVSPETSAEPFRISSTLGDVLFGQLKAWNRSEIILDSERTGLTRLRTDQIREVRQMKHAGVLYDGPRWLEGWRVIKSGRQLDEWKPTEDGQLRTTKHGAEIFRPLPKVERMEIELTLSWVGRPGFAVSLSSPGEILSQDTRLQLNLWEDQLYAEADGSSLSQPRLTLPDGVRQVELIIVWDRPNGLISLRRRNGKEISQLLTNRGSTPNDFGIAIRNAGDSLRIERIRVSRWNGRSITSSAAETNDFVRAVDGTLISGPVQQLRDDQLLVGDASNPTPLSLANLVVAQLDHAPVIEPLPRFLFADGTELVGRWLAADAETVLIESPISPTPIRARIYQLRQIRLARTVRPAEEDQTLLLQVGDQQTLRGRLAPTGDQRLGWLTTGAESPVLLSKEMPFSVRQVVTPTTTTTNFADANAMVHLAGGDRLAGQVHQLTTDRLEATFPLTGTQPVTISLPQAVEFFAGAGFVSFVDSAWKVMGDHAPLSQTHQMLSLLRPTILQHPTLQHDGQLAFDCAWGDDLATTLSIDLGHGNSAEPIVRINFVGEELTMRSTTGGRMTRKIRDLAGNRARIELRGQAETVEVWVNSGKALTCPLPSGVPKTGLTLRGGSNSPSAPRLVLETLRVGHGADVDLLNITDPQAVRMLTQIPRGTADNEVDSLLVVRNGDVLRGRLTQLDDQGATLQVRDRSVTVDRQKLAVWLSLRPNEKQADQSSAKSATRVLLRDGSFVHLDEVGMSGNLVTGHLKSSNHVRIPVEQIKLLHSSAWPSQDTLLRRFEGWQRQPAPVPSTLPKGNGEAGFDSELLGQRLPATPWETLTRGPWNPTEHRGKVIVVQLWATWSQPSLRAISDLRESFRALPDDSVEWIFINASEDPRLVRGFVGARAWPINVALDTEKILVERLGIAVPTTLIVGSDGRIERVFSGAPRTHAKRVVHAVEELLQAIRE